MFSLPYYTVQNTVYYYRLPCWSWINICKTGLEVYSESKFYSTFLARGKIIVLERFVDSSSNILDLQISQIYWWLLGLKFLWCFLVKFLTILAELLSPRLFSVHLRWALYKGCIESIAEVYLTVCWRWSLSPVFSFICSEKHRHVRWVFSLIPKQLLKCQSSPLSDIKKGSEKLKMLLNYCSLSNGMFNLPNAIRLYLFTINSLETLLTTELTVL